MATEIRMHGGHRFESVSESPFPGTPHSRSQALACPECHEPIQLAGGLCGNRQWDAVLLQAERIGAELECHHCGVRFVYLRTATMLQCSAADPQRTPRDG